MVDSFGQLQAGTVLGEVGLTEVAAAHLHHNSEAKYKGLLPEDVMGPGQDIIGNRPANQLLADEMMSLDGSVTGSQLIIRALMPANSTTLVETPSPFGQVQYTVIASHKPVATESDWIRHRAKITRLYWDENLTAQQVKERMWIEEKFHAT